MFLLDYTMPGLVMEGFIAWVIWQRSSNGKVAVSVLLYTHYNYPLLGPPSSFKPGGRPDIQNLICRRLH